MFASLATSLAMVFALAIPAPPTPVPASHPSLPSVTAKTWVVYDATNDVVLAGSGIDETRPMASVTKIMTALVARDELDLDELVRVSATAAGVGESEIGLVAGERWTVEDLLYGIMVRSGNDAAVALAEAAAGSVSGFSELMNAKAAELGLENSSFTNPHGLDDGGHYTTARDLAVMGREFLEDPVLASMSRTKLIVFKPSPSGAPRNYTNTNHLLGEYPDVVGVKTGFTGQAGLVLVSAVETPGRTVIAVVMGSTEHFNDSRKLLDYGTQLITLEDRSRQPLLLEEGGGGSGDIDLEDSERARLQAVGDLPAGTPDQPVVLGDTAVGAAIESRLREVLPAVLGGTG